MASGIYSIKATADFSAHNKEVEKAKDKLTEYKNEATKAQGELNKLNNTNFNKAYTSQVNLQKNIKNTTNVLNGLSGNMMGAIGKFGPYAAAAVAAFKLVEAAIDKAKESNETFSDSMDKLTAQVGGAWTEMVNRITRADFSNLINGLAEAARYAGQIAESLDRAGTFKMVSNPAIGEIQNTITELRIRQQELVIEQKKLKKQGKDYSDIEAQIKAINTQIDKQLEKLKAIYVQQMKNSIATAQDVAAYMGVNRTTVSGLYNKSGVGAYNMRAGLDIMANHDWRYGITNGLAGSIQNLSAGEIVNFMANDIGSPLLNSTQNLFKQLLAAWESGNKTLANQFSHKIFGSTVNATDMSDTLDALVEWQNEVKSKLTEGANGRATQYYNQLNEANAAWAAYLSAKQQSVADKGAEVRTMWTGGNGGNKPKVEVEPVLPEGSIAELEKQLEDLKKKFKLATTDEERAAIKQQIDEAQQQLDQLNGKVKEVKVEPVIAEGSIAYLQKQLKELREQFENTPDAELRVKLLADMGELEKQLKELNTTDAERAAEAMRLKLEAMQKQTEATADTFSSLGSVFSSLGACMDDESQQMMNAFAAVMNGISSVIPQIASLIAAEEAEATASGTASAAKLPYPANLAAIASVMSTLIGVFAAISSINNGGKYANGGIIGGATSVGDLNIARVNRGEMILNGTQQARLFRMLNGNTQVNAITESGNVEFVLRGSDLYGSFTNYNKKRNRAL